MFDLRMLEALVFGTIGLEAKLEDVQCCISFEKYHASALSHTFLATRRSWNIFAFP